MSSTRSSSVSSITANSTLVNSPLLHSLSNGLDAWWKPCIAVIYITMVVLMEGSLHAHGVHLQSKMRVKGT